MTLPGDVNAGRPSTRRAVQLDMALCGLVIACGAPAFTGVFQDWTFLPPAILASFTPPALAIGTGRRRLSPLWLGLTGAIAFMALCALTLTASHAIAPLKSPAAVPSALVDGWALAFTVALPAPGQHELILVPVSTCFAAASACLLAARSSGPLAPLLPVALALLSALALGAGGARHALASAAAVGIAALALVYRRVGRGVSTHRNAHHVRTVLPRATFVVLVVLGGQLVAGAGAYDSDERVDPRELVREPVVLHDVSNPLSQLKPQLNTQDLPRSPEVFDLRLSTRPNGLDRIRVATLDAYDGTEWTSTDSFAMVLSGNLPSHEQVGPSPESETVRETVDVTGLPGPYLPAIGRPVAVDGAGIASSGNSDVLVAADGDAVGLHYMVESRTLDLTDAQISDAHASLFGGANTRRVPPGMPPRLTALADTWTAGAATPGAELLALRDQLRLIPYDDSSSAEPGHSYAALDRALFGDQFDSGRRGGYAEQLASAFAVFARQRGFAARIAVGYRMPEGRGPLKVTEAQAHAWPEVLLDGYGWVAIEPTDLTRIDAPHNGSEPPASPDPPETAVENSPPGVSPRPPTMTPPQRSTPWRVFTDPMATEARTVAVVTVVSLLALLGAYVGLAVGRRRWRRRKRHRSGDARSSVLGAWEEVAERLRFHRFLVSPTLTVTEVSSRIRTGSPDAMPELSKLGPLVDLAIYTTDGPTESDATWAWELVSSATHSLKKVTNRRTRLRAFLTLRTFRRQALIQRSARPPSRP